MIQGEIQSFSLPDLIQWLALTRRTGELAITQDDRRVVGEKWRLPQAVVEAMAHHHNVEGATSDVPYVAIAALADFLATFALSQPRAALEEALADFPPERLTSRPAARLVNLSPRGAADVLRVLPRQLDQALEMVVQ